MYETISLLATRHSLTVDIGEFLHKEVIVNDPFSSPVNMLEEGMKL
jgi:hypothetical protein